MAWADTEKRNAYERRRYRENHEAELARSRKYRAVKREQRNAAERERYWRNRDAERERNREAELARQREREAEWERQRERDAERERNRRNRDAQWEAGRERQKRQGPASWLAAALCKGQDTDLWFSPLRVNEAKAVCRRCKVRQDCLAWAVKTGDIVGVFGGTTPAQRKAMRRMQRTARVG
jgi:WhiB family redox-sensing transcriptional regulator